LIVQSKDVKTRGGGFRCAIVRIVRDLSDLDSRLEAVEKRPPVEKHFTEIKEVVASPAENLGLQFSLGFSSSPFGGIPIASGAVAWKRIVYVEGVVGHTFWNNSFMFEGIDLDTKRRLVGGQVIVYPDENLPVGIVGGWMRIEEISVKYYEYVKLSEGPMLGLRVNPLNFLSLTGVYNPSRQRVAGNTFSKAKNGQFLLSVTAFMEIGGEK
jgi:hypothetical protein